MAIESILPSDSGKVAFEKTGRNFELLARILDELSNTRGYLSTKQLEDGLDFNNIPRLNGIYMLSTRTNAPMVLDYNQWYFVEVTVHKENYLTQEAWTFVGEKSQRWDRVLDNNVWREWVEIATTTKKDIPSSSLLNGWTMWGRNGYGDNLVGCKTGKQVQLNGLLRCGVKTQNTLILTLPEELRPTCNIIKNVSCYPYGTATIEIQSVGNVLVGNIGEGTLAISMGDVSYSTL